MTIEINTLIWTVQKAPRGSDNLKSANGVVCLGTTRYRELEIYIDENLSKELFRQTVIHELAHAYSFSFGVHLYATEENEEAVCDFMGAHLDDIHEDTNMIMATIFTGGTENGKN